MAKQFLQVQPGCRWTAFASDGESIRQAADVLPMALRLTAAESCDLSKYGMVRETVDCFIYHGRFLAGLTEKEIAALLKAHLPYLAARGQVLFSLDYPGYVRNMLALAAGQAPICDPGPALPVMRSAIGKAGLHEVASQHMERFSDQELRQSPEMQNLVQAICAGIQASKMAGSFAPWTCGYFLRTVRKTEVPRAMAVQTVMGDMHACGRVRVYAPNSMMRNEAGIWTDALDGGINLEHGRSFPDRIVIRQRRRLRYAAAVPQLKLALREGYIIVAENDDYPFYKEEWNECYRQTCYADFRCAHAIQVSTKPLAEFMRQYNPNVYVIPNQLTSLPEKRDYQADWEKPLTIFFGAINREDEWQDIMPILNVAAKKFGPKLRFKVLFDKKFYEALETDSKELIGQEYHDGFAPYEVYESTLHESDIALLPLRDNTFNRMKSDLKFIESAGNGAVVLASPTVYEDSVSDGVNGFLYRSPMDFAEKLRVLLGDPVRRISMAEAGYRYVKENRLLSQHYMERLELYRELVRRKPELDRMVDRKIDEVSEEALALDLAEGRDSRKTLQQEREESRKKLQMEAKGTVEAAKPKQGKGKTKEKKTKGRK